MTTIPVYYLDEPLSDDDREFIIASLVERDGIADDSVIEETRVPNVLPADDSVPRDSGADTDLLKNHLIRAGLRKHAGQQIVWVMPKSTAWGVRFQFSIFEITGYYPYVLQRWSFNEDESIERRDTRLIDIHGAMGGKDGA